jgi:RNA recognition motif-containing protein
MMTLTAPLPLLVEVERHLDEVVVAAPVLQKGSHSRLPNLSYSNLLLKRSDGAHNPGNNLHVSGLSNKIDQRDLEAVFSKFGRVSFRLFKSDLNTHFTT